MDKKPFKEQGILLQETNRGGVHASLVGFPDKHTRRKWVIPPFRQRRGIWVSEEALKKFLCMFQVNSEIQNILSNL